MKHMLLNYPLLRATKERAIYMRAHQSHHRPLLATTHIYFVYCVITAVQNVRIPLFPIVIKSNSQQP